MRIFRPLVAGLALGAPLVLPADARSPRTGTGTGPLEGTWSIKIKAVCHPFDGSDPFRETSLDDVTLTDTPSGVGGVPSPSEVTMSGFLAVPGSPLGSFAFASSAGVRYGREFHLVGESGNGSIRGVVKVRADGTADAFRAVGHNFDASGIVDVKIRAVRTPPR